MGWLPQNAGFILWPNAGQVMTHQFNFMTDEIHFMTEPTAARR
jgi:hypothetical protein